MYKVIIIGSGIAGISAAKILIKKGIKPLIIDSGEELEKEKRQAKNLLASTKISEWEYDTLKKVVINGDRDKKIPRKYFMGSNFFYGKSNFLNKILINNLNQLPAFSYAKGGLANGWGSAVLPLPSEEQIYYPFNLKKLDKYYFEAIQDLPYTASIDGLIKKFSIIKNPDNSYIKDDFIKYFEKKILSHSYVKNKNLFNYGSSRLLFNNKKFYGCRNCGECMSGCFNDHIYKPSEELNLLSKKK